MASSDPVNPLKFNYFRAFRERLKLESPEKEREWERRGQEEMERTGDPKAGCMVRLMEEFGYRGAKEERRLWDERHGVSSRLQAAEEREQKGYEEALAMLPAHAPAHKEIEWVRAHPALSRTPGKKTSGPPVTSDEILAPPHGRAPSQSAVQQLIVWSQKPQEFFKQLYGGKLATPTAMGADPTDEESLASERQTIDQTLAVLRQFSAQAADMAEKAIGLKG